MAYEFNIGDKVVLYNGFGKRDICTVERITAAGNIAVSGHKNVLFKPNGNERGGSPWHPMYIIPATPDVITEIEQQMYVAKVKSKMMHILQTLTYEQAVELSATSMFQGREDDT